MDWYNLSEPPLMMDLSIKELFEIVKKGETMFCEIAKILWHSHAVEKAGKIVSEGALAICSKEKRDGMIRVKLNSRSKIPSFGFYIISKINLIFFTFWDFFRAIELKNRKKLSFFRTLSS
jgi:hypothetical protein